MKHLTEPQLNEYLDQMLDVPTQQKVEAHLSDCEGCRAQIAPLEILFSTLDELPEVPLTRDLKVGVLAGLPKTVEIPTLWQQPAFLAQSLLTVILLTLTMPILNRQFDSLSSFFTFPVIELTSFAEIIAKLSPLFRWDFRFSFAFPEISFTTPTLPSIPISLDTNIVLLLIISAGMMWGIGNFSLLRSKPEVRK